jgi:hypothetical protein
MFGNFGSGELLVIFLVFLLVLSNARLIESQSVAPSITKIDICESGTVTGYAVSMLEGSIWRFSDNLTGNSLTATSISCSGGSVTAFCRVSRAHSVARILSPHASGGQYPLALCPATSAAIAAINVTLRDKLWEVAAAKGEYLISKLQALASQYPEIVLPNVPAGYILQQQGQLFDDGSLALTWKDAAGHTLVYQRTKPVSNSFGPGPGVGPDSGPGGAPACRCRR